MKLARLCRAFLAAWLAGCVGTTPAMHNEPKRQLAVATGEEACRARSALVLLCGERSCAFYRCGEVVPREAAPAESSDYPDGHPPGSNSQGAVYKKALGGEPARVAPRLGVIR